MNAARLALSVGLALVAAGAVVTVAEADFAGVVGFSGRYGFTCTSCHVTTLDAVPDAEVDLTGLPGQWLPGQQYDLTITVSGGPPAAPAGAPQGGFEIDTDVGRFSVPASMDGLLRQPSPSQMTYTPEGTLMRTWQVAWHAPDAQAMVGMPAPATFWLAAVAANGNHNIQLNASDGGELGDRAAAVIVSVDASPQAFAAWEAIPLRAPSPALTTFTIDHGDPLAIDGLHDDANATTLSWRVDDGPWSERDTQPAWRLILADLAPGRHDIALRSLGAGRVSDLVTVQVEVQGGIIAQLAGDQATPTVPVALVGVTLMGLAGRRRP